MFPWTAADLLGHAVDHYHLMCRNFRNRWNWPPSEVDGLGLARIYQIHDEMIEDYPQE
ncbi:MAG: hypothetical protein ACO1HP_14805 [Bacteroidota bacterium]